MIKKSTKLFLKKDPTLADIQKYVSAMEVERGFNKELVAGKCILLGEEIGELFKAIRKFDKVTKTDSNSKFTTIEEEIADILIVLCAIANRYNIKIEKALREKEEINKKREWR